jgi:hypothetical protein
MGFITGADTPRWPVRRFVRGSKIHLLIVIPYSFEVPNPNGFGSTVSPQLHSADLQAVLNAAITKWNNTGLVRLMSTFCLNTPGLAG